MNRWLRAAIAASALAVLPAVSWAEIVFPGVNGRQGAAANSFHVSRTGKYRVSVRMPFAGSIADGRCILAIPATSACENAQASDVSAEIYEAGAPVTVAYRFPANAYEYRKGQIGLSLYTLQLRRGVNYDLRYAIPLKLQRYGAAISIGIDDPKSLFRFSAK